MSEPAPARLAATVLMVRDGASGLEVFMVKRHRQIEFASGALVFPGGAVDPSDREITAAGFDDREHVMRVAAIRETFEESDVLLARGRGAAGWLEGERAKNFARQYQGRAFNEAVAAEKLELGLDALILFAHWITPRALPKRFDTHFYIVAAPADQIARHDGFESVDSVWIHPLRALAEAEKGVFTIVPATGLNLKLLGQSSDVAGAVAAARQRRVVTVEPVAERTATGFHLRIPLEAGYGVDEFTI
jgi:8-oxo-dGTP pyrophosphatase MutT (NUDIX family)